MSKIGSQPIKIPEEVKIKTEPGQVRVKGPKGELVVQAPPWIKVARKEDKLEVSRRGGSGKIKALHGLVRSLINNAVIGVTRGFEKTLEVKGVGYRVRLEGEKLILSLGFSHPIEVKKEKEIDYQVKDNKITISGVDKQLVGQVAANLRKIRPPDPYKGKGIRYKDEVIKLKPGKAAKTGVEAK